MNARDPKHTPHMDDATAAFVRRRGWRGEPVAPVLTDEQIVLGLLRRFINEEAYCDVGGDEGEPRRRLCIDGTTYNVTEGEIAAFERWLET